MRAAAAAAAATGRQGYPPDGALHEHVYTCSGRCCGGWVGQKDNGWCLADMLWIDCMGDEMQPASAACAGHAGTPGPPCAGVDDAEENGLAPGGPSASKQPVIVVQPGGCVDLAIKGGAEEDPAPGGHARAASQDLEAQSTGAGEARAPRQRGMGGWVAPSPLASPSTSVQMVVRPLASWSPASRPQVLMAWPSLQLHEVTPHPAMYYPPPRRPQRGGWMSGASCGKGVGGSPKLGIKDQLMSELVQSWRVGQ